MAKKTALQALAGGKCPRCRTGSMFVHPNFRLKGFDKMYTNCPVCGQKYDPEPGFYFGAMFVSYAFSVALTLIVAFLVYFIFGNPPMWVYTTAIIVVVLLLFPTMFRYSRIFYLHMFGGIRYNPSPDPSEPT